MFILILCVCVCPSVKHCPSREVVLLWHLIKSRVTALVFGLRGEIMPVIAGGEHLPV